MATRAVVPQQQQQPRGGEAKQKNEPAEGRNRRVLQDIGNLVKVSALEGKPHRPITRSFCAKLLANNAQAGAEKNKNPVTETVVIDGPETKVPLPKKKVSVKEIKTMIVVSSDEVEEGKKKTVNGRTSKDGPLRKEIKTMTSILTARSKAACGVITTKPKLQILDIDESDVGNELAEVEYVDDIYKYYKLTEDENRVHDYMCLQPEINDKMRSILIDWLIEVHAKFDLMPETLYLTINIVDRYLSMKNVPRRELQLVGISSMLIACKYEEIWAPEVSDFVSISDCAYVREQILVMEKMILGKLEWYLTVPTAYVFLVRYIKASAQSDNEMENLVFFLAELGVVQYSTVIKYRPSMIAASAVYAARCSLNRSPFWNDTLKHYTGYSEDQLMDCAKLLVSYHSVAAESKLRAAYRKFLKPERGSVAMLEPAKMLLPQSSTYEKKYE